MRTTIPSATGVLQPTTIRPSTSDHAEPADADRVEVGVVAEVGDVDGHPGCQGGLEHCRVFGYIGLERAAVDREFIVTFSIHACLSCLDKLSRMPLDGGRFLGTYFLAHPAAYALLLNDLVRLFFSPRMASAGQALAHTMQPMHFWASILKEIRALQTLAGQLLVPDVGFVFVSEVAERGQHRVGGRLPQSAKRALRERTGQRR